MRELHAYRQKAYAAIRGVIESHPALEGPSGWGRASWAVFMGFEHERIHIETSSVLIRELPLHAVRKPEFWPEYHPSASRPEAPAALPAPGADFPVNDLLDVAAERVVLGKHVDYPSFGWDNEYGRRAVEVPAFRASRYKVTNGEFLAFVRAGGYANPAYWDADAWGWKTFRNVKWPTFWVPDGPQGARKSAGRRLSPPASPPAAGAPRPAPHYPPASSVLLF